MNLNPIQANMTELSINGLTILFSYKTPVAFINYTDNKVFKTSKHWSQTTTRHINKWLALNDISKDKAIETTQESIDALIN